MLTRREAVVSVGLCLFMPGVVVRAEERPTITVYKDPTCGCCGKWVDHLVAAGFAATTIPQPEINRRKTQLGVPAELWSCHTATLGAYVLEGHVPVGAINRLLTERPRVRGLAVPGMPVGSPGMEVSGIEPETYEVMTFGPKRVFMTFRGTEESG